MISDAGALRTHGRSRRSTAANTMSAHTRSLALLCAAVLRVGASASAGDGSCPTVNRAIVLRSRPDAEITDANLELVEREKPAVAEGKLLVRNRYASLDPTHRIWMGDAPQYWGPVELGEPMRAITVGVVEASKDKDVPVGAHVVGVGGVQDYYLTSRAEGAAVLPPEATASVPVTAYLSALSLVIGLTASVGVDLLEVAEGDTVVVSAGAGAVGSLAGQLAKLKGARVIGVVGTAEKAEWLTTELGFDAALNYKVGREQLIADLRAAAPRGVDGYFDNTGGVTTEAVLQVANNGMRLALCGVISGYNSGELGLASYDMLLHRRVQLKGFICTDHAEQLPAVQAKLGALIAQGRLKYKEDIQEGIENYLPALNRLFDGTNTGKLILKLF